MNPQNCPAVHHDEASMISLAHQNQEPAIPQKNLIYPMLHNIKIKQNKIPV